MGRIALASMFILVSLLGLLFGVGMLVLSRTGLPSQYLMAASGGFAIAVVLLQYALGPVIIDRVMAIRWAHPAEVSPAFSDWMNKTCSTYKIAVPQFGIIEDQGPNAFTYGNGAWNGRVVVSRGLITMLNEDEFKAVVAHELGHIKNRDFIFMTLVQAIVLAMYAMFRMSRYQLRKESIVIIPISFLAYQISYYLSLLISRLREYMADHASAQILQNANPLASALVKISYGLADSSGTAFQAAYLPGKGPQSSPSKPRPAAGKPGQILLPPVQQATATVAPPQSMYDYNAPLPNLNQFPANSDIPPEVMAKVRALQTKANQAEIAPLMGLMGVPQHATPGLGVAPAGKRSRALPPSTIGAIGVCGISGALSSVAWMQPGGGVDNAVFAKAARWELFNPWARIAELVSTHPLTARRIKALMKLNQRWNIPSEFDFAAIQPGKYPRFFVDVLLIVLPYLLAVGVFAACALPGSHLHGLRAIGAGLMTLFIGFAVVHFAMYKPGFTRARVLTLLGELNVSHMNPKPAVVEGVFTGYMDAVTPWAHHFVLQDDTGFVATQYRQPLGAEYVAGLFKTGRSLGRPVRVEGWFRRFGHPVLEIYSFTFLDTMEQHKAHYATFRFVLFVLGFLFALFLFALGSGRL